MLSQHEIRIKAGLDYSKVTAGLTDIRAQVFKLAKDVPNKLSSLLKANLYTAAAGLISEALPSWDEIWNKVYGVDEAGTKRLEESTKRLRTIREEAQKAAQSLEDAFKKARFQDSDTLGKRGMLLEDQANQQIDVKAARDEVARLKAMLARDRSNPELAGRLGAAQKGLSEKELQLFNTGRALKDINSKLTPDQVASIFSEMLANSIPDVYKLRSEFRKQMALRNAFNMNGALEQGMLAGVNAKMAMDQINTIVSARGIQGIGNMANSMSGAGPFGIIKDSLEAATKAAMSVTIQRVKIVEVE